MKKDHSSLKFDQPANQKKADTDGALAEKLAAGQARQQRANQSGEEAAKQQKEQTHRGRGGPLFSIVDEQESSAILQQAKADVSFENPRYSGQARSSVLSQQTLEFYARRSKLEEKQRRHSDLANRLSQMDVTKRLLSSKFSPAVATSVLLSSRKPGKGVRTDPKQSLRYPSVGKLDLDGFLASSESDNDESDKGERAADVQKRKSKQPK